MNATPPPWAAAYGPGVPLHLDHDDSTLVDRLERSVRVQPHRVALDLLGGTTTYARFADRVARVAEGLRRLGAGPGDCVAGYKVPRRFVVVDALPVNAMGRVRRREVVSALRDG